MFLPIHHQSQSSQSAIPFSFSRLRSCLLASPPPRPLSSRRRFFIPWPLFAKWKPIVATLTPEERYLVEVLIRSDWQPRRLDARLPSQIPNPLKIRQLAMRCRNARSDETKSLPRAGRLAPIQSPSHPDERAIVIYDPDDPDGLRPLLMLN